MGFDKQKIAIIGGGLGGMAFANAALHAGLSNIELYEQAPQFTEVGAGVNITRNANRVLDACGLKDEMMWKSSRNPPCYMEYRHYATGEYLGEIEEFGEPASRQIHRAHLLDALKARIPPSVLHTGKRLRSIQFRAQQYVLEFHDDTIATADIVIGCDGIKSVVREHLGITDDPTYSGQVVYRGYVQYEDLPRDTAEIFRKTVVFRGHKRHILTLPIGNDDSHTSRIGVIAFMPESLGSWKSESWLASAPIDDLQAHVHGWSRHVQELIAGLRKSSSDGWMLKQTLFVRDPVDKWYHIENSHPSAGIILVGDSVHSTLPHQGQGTCMAIESGITLAIILRNWASQDLSEAARLYQDIRKPRTDKVTSTSYEAGKIASAELPDSFLDDFNAESLRIRMKWIMEEDVLSEVWRRGAPFFAATPGAIDMPNANATRPAAVQASL